MSGGDIHVNTDRLKDHADRYDDHIEWLNSHIGKLRAGPIMEAVNERYNASGGRYGGFDSAVSLARIHGRLADEMLWLQEQINGGLRTAKDGINQTVDNYRSVDDQRSLDFDEIKKLLPGEQPGDEEQQP